MFMFVLCIRDFCECSVAGRREESLGEEHFTKHPTVRLNDARSADSRCGLANAALLESTLRLAASHMAHFPLLSERYGCVRVGGPVERETWWMKSESLGWWDWRSAASSWPVFF
ncbi:MAG TPA: hypothetical protein VK512_06545 [Xanthobacteraceae bacterium]|jgi:hypothetical protein|nr:hypothetical protein [Xanthobacteraceae bacterium]